MNRVQESIASGNFDSLIHLTNSFPLSLAHQDNRRLIQEYNGDDFSVQRFTVFDNSTGLGNHFHTKGDQNISEIFLIEVGKGTLILQNLDTSGAPFGEQDGFISILSLSNGYGRKHLIIEPASRRNVCAGKGGITIISPFLISSPYKLELATI